MNLVPFRLQRINNNNSNGERKQAKQQNRQLAKTEQKKREVLDRTLKQYAAVKEQRDQANNEVEFNSRKNRKFKLAEKRAKDKNSLPEQELNLILAEEFQNRAYGMKTMTWTERERIQLIELVKKHGRNYKAIHSEFEDPYKTKSLQKIIRQITYLQQRETGDSIFLQKLAESKFRAFVPF